MVEIRKKQKLAENVNFHLPANASHDQISNALSHTNDAIRHQAITHPNINNHILLNVLKTTNITDNPHPGRLEAARHPIADAKTLNTALNHKDPETRLFALHNPNITNDQLHHVYKHDKHDDVKFVARQKIILRKFYDKNSTSSEIDKGLAHRYSFHRMEAARSPNATQQHISTALNDTDAKVRAAAILNRNASKLHIKQGMNDKSGYVRAVTKHRQFILDKDH